MHHGMIAERLDVHRPAATPALPFAAMAGALKELRAAADVLSRLGLAAYDRLDGEDLYDLGLAQSLVAGAVKKLEATGVTPA